MRKSLDGNAAEEEMFEIREFAANTTLISGQRTPELKGSQSASSCSPWYARLVHSQSLY